MSIRTHRFPSSTGRRRAIEVRNAAGSVTVRGARGRRASSSSRSSRSTSAAEQLLDRVEIDVRAGDAVRRPALRVAVPERRLLRTPAFAIRVTTPPDAAVRVAAPPPTSSCAAASARWSSPAPAATSPSSAARSVQLRTASGERPHRHASTGAARPCLGVRATCSVGRATRPAEGCAPPPATSRSSTPRATSAVTTASGDVTVGAAAGEARCRRRPSPAMSRSA